MKVLITGINGMLGGYVYETLSALSVYEIYGTGRSNTIFSNLTDYFQGDLCDIHFIKKVSEPKYDFIVHCAAMVNLNICESDYDLAERIHVKASNNLAMYNPNAVFIYISTDSIFDGQAIRRTELDLPKPLNNYALTKYLGGKIVREEHGKAYELRLNIYGFKIPFADSLFEWLYKSFKARKTIYGYENVTFNPLYARQIAEVIFHFMKVLPPFGIYNLGCDNSLSKYEFLIKVAEIFNWDGALINKSEAKFENLALKRPHHTVLNTQKLQNVFPHLDLRFETGLAQLKADVEFCIKE